MEIRFSKTIRPTVCAALLFLAYWPRQAAAQDEGPWTVNSEVSQLDGSGNYAASLRSANTIPNSIGVPDHALLVVRCQKKELEAFIHWPPFIGDNDITARWKFDDGPIWKQIWNPAADGTSTFIQTPSEFLANLSNAKRLVVDVPPYQQSNVEAVFDLGDPTPIVSAAIAMCRA